MARPPTRDPFDAPAPVPYARPSPAPTPAPAARDGEGAPAASDGAQPRPAAPVQRATIVESGTHSGEPTSEKGRVDKDLEYLVRARYPLIYVLSFEELRVEESIRALADRRSGKVGETKVFMWSITEGFRRWGYQDGKWAALEDYKDQKDPLKALDFIKEKKNERAFYVLRDFHPFQKNPEVVRKLRDLNRDLKDAPKTVFLTSPLLSVPQELEKELAVVEYPLPDLKELSRTLDEALVNLPIGRRPKLDPRERERVIEAALGLTEHEARNVFDKSLVQAGALDLEIISGEKERIVRKSGILEFFRTQEQMNDIGGMDVLKEWLLKRENAFTQEARDYGLPRPKGILLLGVPGCGKSLTAKAAGSFLKMPLLRLDVGRVFAGIVGSSEENIRRALAMAEAVAPCILWLDELEKGLSGSGSSNFSDGGTSARVFGTFITWMQEKKAPVFVIATSNDVTQLPPELLRKGRFDEAFFVDLPSLPERREIAAIHIRKRKRDPALFDVEALAEKSEGMSGAELEQAVVSAMYDAFFEHKEVATPHVVKALSEIVPLSRTMKEKIRDLRIWCHTRARPASSLYVEVKAGSRAIEMDDVNKPPDAAPA